MWPLPVPVSVMHARLGSAVNEIVISTDTFRDVLFSAAGSHDKHVFLWKTHGDCENYMAMKGKPVSKRLKRRPTGPHL